jgi:hypothetical protein
MDVASSITSTIIIAEKTVSMYNSCNPPAILLYQLLPEASQNLDNSI